MSTYPAFTSRHYNAIAKDIREVRATSKSIDFENAVNAIALKLAERFSLEDELFIPKWFLAATFEQVSK